MPKKPKLTKAKIKEFIADEKAGNKVYRKYGLKSLAKDEARHKKFLEKKLKSQSKNKPKRRK